MKRKQRKEISYLVSKQKKRLSQINTIAHAFRSNCAKAPLLHAQTSPRGTVVLVEKASAYTSLYWVLQSSNRL